MQKQQGHQTNQIDSYSALIVSKYFITTNDFINLICVCKKFKETTEKLRYNPISITSLKLFPKIQTQHLYSENDITLNGIDDYEIWYQIDYDQSLGFKNNTKCHNVEYTKENRKKYGNEIPNTITVLGKWCYEYSNIIEITIPNKVTSIEMGAFNYCSKLKNVILPNKINELPYKCFFACDSLATITIPTTVQSFGDHCFANCFSFESFTIPKTVKTTGIFCFYNCIKLKKLEITSTTELKLGSLLFCHDLINKQNYPQICFKS